MPKTSEITAGKFWIPESPARHPTQLFDFQSTFSSILNRGEFPGKNGLILLILRGNSGELPT
jgi:hypothetical protein